MKYDVTIQAKITKTYTVEAENEDEAYQLASDRFELAEEFNVNETYEQDTLEICASDDDAEPTNERQPIKRALTLLDQAITTIYNIEGDQYQDAYDKLQIIFDQLQEVNSKLEVAA